MDRLVLTIEQAARECQVHPRTITRAIERGHLEAHRLGEDRALRIRPAALEAWLDARSTLRESRPLPTNVTPISPVGAGMPRARHRQGDRLRFKDHKKAS